ncbi:MAG: hypothetical protein PHS93_03270 [Candidatus Omnitrophica bacterium]|nr:hypothetical protein [Candidatus Omnitrophota bacterium]MDD5352172.1 hypothetical protein [Candidatus Omnitrophota bacterium]MDD5549770.1 hypothetical protein [Candidatus Omnitrophota bacterium]
MNISKLINEKPVGCLGLLFWIASHILFCGNLYEQAINKEINLPKEKIWIENKISHSNRNNYLDLTLTDASASGVHLPTGSSISIIAVQLNS